MNLQLAFTQLFNSIGVKQVYFWGKIQGTIKNYFICYHFDETPHADVAKKVFYWCSSSTFIFAQLPEIVEEHKEELSSLNTFFTGEFDNVLIEATGEGEVIDQDLGLVLPPKNVTELDRLSCTVRTID